MSTIGQIYVAAKEGIEDKRAERDQHSFIFAEWHENKQGQRMVKKFTTPDWNEFFRVLRWLGFRRYDLGNGYNLIRIVDNVAYIVEIRNIIDAFIGHVKAMPSNHYFSHAQDKMTNYIFQNQGTLFAKIQLERLIEPDEKFVFNSDTETEAFYYFNNGFITVTASGISLEPYTKLPTYSYYQDGDVHEAHKIIWKSQLSKYDFKRISADAYKKHDWYLFLQNVAQKETPERLVSLMQGLGYMLHGYIGNIRKAFILTDSKVGTTPEGRSGKTILGRSVVKFLNANANSTIADMISGKTFDVASQFKYMSLSIDTRVVVLNDVKRNFKFEALFNDITEGLDCQRKGENSFRLAVKMMIPTNETITLEGGSARDRAFEFEMSSHYNEHWKPEMEFGKDRMFFDHWNTDDWQIFHNIMLECVRVFLEKGLPKTVKSINLGRRKALSETTRILHTSHVAGQDFIDFMNSRFVEGDVANHIALIPFEDEDWRKKYNGYDSNTFFSDFCTFAGENPDNKLLKKQFSSCIKIYVEHSDFITKMEDPRSNSIKKYYFFANQIKNEAL